MVTVRAAALEDYDAWLPLWRGYQAFYETSIPQEVTEETWRRFFDPAEPARCALAEADGAVAGLVHFIPHRSTWTTGDYCYLQDLFVAAEVRGGGVGRRLIEHVYDEARAMGCSRVYWLTHETNRAAMALYDRVAERSGFVQYRRLL